MILIDTRPGSSETVRRRAHSSPLAGCSTGSLAGAPGSTYTAPGLNSYHPLSLPSVASLCPLTIAGETYCADVLIVGNGPSGALRIGIEVKSVSDLASSLWDGRLQAGLEDGLMDGQLSHLLRCYDLAILMVYGGWRPCPETGVLQTKHEKSGKWFDHPNKAIKFSYVQRFLLSPAFLLSGVQLIQVPTLESAAAWIYEIDQEWSKPYDSHKATKVLDKSGNLKDGRKRNGIVSFEPVEPGTDRWRLKHRVKIASQLPGVGYEIANQLARAFPSTRAMINASIEQLAEVELKGETRTGKKRKLKTTRAEAIDDVLR